MSKIAYFVGSRLEGVCHDIVACVGSKKELCLKSTEKAVGDEVDLAETCQNTLEIMFKNMPDKMDTHLEKIC